MLKEKLETKKCFSTAWGRLITEEEAYRQLNRQIAAMTANLFQVMPIYEPNSENPPQPSAKMQISSKRQLQEAPMNRKTMLMLLSMKHLTSRSFVKNPAGLVALPVTPAMNGKIWPVE